LAALGALGLVVLGTLGLLWPSRPKHPARGASTPAEPAPRRWRSSIPRHAASRREAYLKMPPASALAPAPAQPPFPRAAPAAPVVEVAVTPAVESSVEGPIAIVDRCFELYQQHRYADVVSIAAAALGNDAPPARRPAGARRHGPPRPGRDGGGAAVAGVRAGGDGARPVAGVPGGAASPARGARASARAGRARRDVPRALLRDVQRRDRPAHRAGDPRDAGGARDGGAGLARARGAPARERSRRGAAAQAPRGGRPSPLVG